MTNVMDFVCAGMIRALQVWILTASGPTAYPTCTLMVLALWWLLPFWVFVSLVVLYVADCIFGKTEIFGGRESQWVKASPAWEVIPDWFGMECILAEGCEFQPGQTYIFLTHPHGVFSWANCFFYCTALKQNTLLQRFPFLDICISVARIVVRVPFLRDMCFSLGCRDVCRQALTHALREGRSIAINLDGEAGALVARPGFESAVLLNRRGFVELALSTGAHLVPCYVFGLVDVYSTGPAWLLPIQRFFHRRFHWALPFFYSHYGWLPARRKVTLVIGKPLPVPQPEVFGARPDAQATKALHAEYIEALHTLFDEYKDRLGFADRTLHILDANHPY
eukprot:GGOE01002683.1.p1 GENE.GGOE01002683.1~~GGOE01002683.1.p1  ORF type:complete len:360 (+),score=45.67 GGOE01002683.1:73-1080(+)